MKGRRDVKDEGRKKGKTKENGKTKELKGS